MAIKVIVIGIDGADPEYIAKGIEKGYLPNLKKLIDAGVYCKLKSSIPPLSLPAWLCIYTSKNPGRYGIFDFVQRVPGTYSTKLVNWKIKDKTIWQILNDAGKKVCMVNNYITFPPDPVDGVMISAIDGPVKNCFYPKRLENEINSKLGKLKYESSFGYFGIPEEYGLKKDIKFINNKLKLAKYILKNKTWDFFMTTFNVDCYHHGIDSEETILKMYMIIDDAVGELIKLLDKETNIIIFSDHGGGKSKKEFYVNEFLRKNGWLKLKETKIKSQKGRILMRLGLSMENILKLIQAFKIDNFLGKVLPKKIWELAKARVPRRSVLFEKADIDWSKTKAFSPYPASGAICLNLKGRDPEGIIFEKSKKKSIKEISDKLKNLKDPKTNKKIPVKIFTDKIYSGSEKEFAPEISYILDDWKYVPKTAFSGKIFNEPRDSGNHRPFGIFIAMGPDIKTTSKIKGAKILDIMPTILKVFGIENPADIDGKVLNIVKARKAKKQKIEKLIEDIRF